jgi:hypothetical protein
VYVTDPPPEQVPEAELAAALELTAALRPAAVLVNVGHGRDPGSRARAAAFVAAWTARGGEIGTVASWPATAASWLRPATRLVAGAPDAWVVADRPEGWRGIGPRLLATGRWRAERTVAFAGLGTPELPFIAGRPATDGLRGAGGDGGTWFVVDGWLRVVDAASVWTGQPSRSNGSA